MALEIYRYRFFILGGVVAIWWAKAGTRRFVVSLLYIGLYPAVLLLWHAPRHLLKSWVRVFAFALAFLASFRAVRLRLLLNFAALAATTVIVTFKSPWLVSTAMLYLVAYLLTLYVRQFRAAFSSRSYLRSVTQLITGHWVELREKLISSQLNELGKREAGSQEYFQVRGGQLQFLYFLNKVARILAGKLQTIKQSRLALIYSLLAIAHLFFVTVAVFALEYYGLAQAQPRAFTGAESRSIWFFGYMSLSTMLSASVGVESVTPIAMLLVSLHRLFGVLLLVVVVSIVVSVLRERYDEDLQDLVNKLDRERQWIEDVSVQRYGISFSEIEAEVQRIAPGLVQLMLYWEGHPPRGLSS